MPRAPGIVCRSATAADLPFIDQVQKMYGRHLGFMYASALAKRIDQGGALIAEAEGCQMGYLIGQDRYSHNDECGIVFQIAVVPARHRRQIGACLLREWMHQLPYGTRLACCWCAQDLAENRFWESMGFVPLAFRAGGSTMQRMHIFWIRRTRAGDQASPLWYPKATANGAMGAGRLILPIPPGHHWADDLPRITPGPETSPVPLLANGLPDPNAKPAAAPALPEPPPETAAERQARIMAGSKHLGAARPKMIRVMTASGIRYIPTEASQPAAPKKPKPKARPRNDDRHVAAARELRDRFLEQVNSGQVKLIATERYDPARQIADASSALGGMFDQLMQPDQAQAPRLSTADAHDGD